MATISKVKPPCFLQSPRSCHHVFYDLQGHTIMFSTISKVMLPCFLRSPGSYHHIFYDLQGHATLFSSCEALKSDSDPKFSGGKGTGDQVRNSTLPWGKFVKSLPHETRLQQDFQRNQILKSFQIILKRTSSKALSMNFSP